MLSFTEFTSEFIDGCMDMLRDEPGAFTEIETRPVNKPQRGELTGLRFIRNGSRIAPTLYAEDMYTRYAQGCPIDKIARDAVESIKGSFDIPLPFPEDEFDLSAMLPDIRPRLISRERNLAIEKTSPHMDAGEGLMLIADVVRGDFRVMITNAMLEDAGLTDEELFDVAFGNIPENEAVMFGLTDMVCEPPGGREELLGSYRDNDDSGSAGSDGNSAGSDGRVNSRNNGCDTGNRSYEDFDVFVLSNRDMYWGAAALFYPGVKDKLHDMLGDFYVIPSSVHELLLMPVSVNADPGSLIEMIWSANRSVVDEDEVLSDDLYLCKKGVMRLSSYRDPEAAM